MGTLGNLIKKALSEEGYIEKQSNKDLDSKTANRGDQICQRCKCRRPYGLPGPAMVLYIPVLAGDAGVWCGAGIKALEYAQEQLCRV